MKTGVEGEESFPLKNVIKIGLSSFEAPSKADPVRVQVSFGCLDKGERNGRQDC
jgi:hypothetical protein